MTNPEQTYETRDAKESEPRLETQTLRDLDPATRLADQVVAGSKTAIAHDDD